MGARGDGTGHGQQKWGYGWGAVPCFSSITYKYSLCLPCYWQRTRGCWTRSPSCGVHCLCWLLGLTCVCLTPWPSAGAGAVQQPEPPAATPAPSLPSPCPRKPPHRNSPRTTGLAQWAVLLGKDKRPRAQAAGGHAGPGVRFCLHLWSPFRPCAQRRCSARLGASALVLATPCWAPCVLSAPSRAEACQSRLCGLATGQVVRERAAVVRFHSGAFPWRWTPPCSASSPTGLLAPAGSPTWSRERLPGCARASRSGRLWTAPSPASCPTLFHSLGLEGRLVVQSTRNTAAAS